MSQRKTSRWTFVAAICVGMSWPAPPTARASEFDWTEAPLTKVHQEWKHVSPTSAVLYFQSDGAARSYVEYGPTARYGKRTTTSEQASFGHLHRITGLKTGQTCHYRLVCVGADGKTVATEDAAFTPKAIEGAIPLPGDLAGPPYVLDKAGATYVLTADIAAEAGVAIEIKAENITLDLDGHTVAYATKAGRSGTGGVALSKAGKAHLLNGIIRQGTATGTGAAISIAASGEPELAGLTVETVGNASGVHSMWNFSGGRIHHNLFLDKAPKSADLGGYWYRCCITVGAPGVKIDHNLIRGTGRLLRVRNAGGMSDATGADIFENDLHLDAHNYTAEGIGLDVPGGVIHNNRIICQGCPATAVMLNGSAARYAKVRSNRIKVRPTDSPPPSDEGMAPYDLCMGIAAKEGAYGLDIRDNTILTYGRGYDAANAEGGCTGNGIRLVNMMFDYTNTEVCDNRIIAMAEDGQMAACVVVTGGSQANTLVFRKNKLISNRCQVIITDRQHSVSAKGERDGGRNARFVGNTLVRVGERDDFQTVRCGRESIDSHAYFLDTAFEGGAGWDGVAFAGEGGVRELRVGKAAELTVKDASGKPIWDASVTLESADGARVYVAGRTGPDGKVELPVVEHLLTPEGKVSLAEAKFVVAKTGLGSVELPAGPLPKEVTLGADGDDPEQVIAKLRKRFADKAAPEADWDWLRAPLTTIKGENLHASVNSACVYWQTDGRAWGYVEYGPTAKYGFKTQPHPKPNFAHLHHLRSLKGGRICHYRMVAIGVDGKRLVSADKIFQTHSGEGLVKLPGDAGGPPFVITEPGHYLLTEDVTLAEGDAIVIKAEGVVIDLNGYIVTYGAAPPPGRPARAIVADGVRGRGPRILNGVIREGPHDAARTEAVRVSGCNDYELGWLGVEIRGFLTSALAAGGGGANAHIHHNLFWDRGHAYANRHQGCRTVAVASSGGARVHHNIIVSARNRALSGSGRGIEVFENTIELLGHSTNCSGIGIRGPGHRIHHNLVEAHGEHPCAIWGWRNNQIYDNKLYASADMCISYEYGGPLGGDGFRTNYDTGYDGIAFDNNVVVVRGKANPAKGFKSRSSWVFWLAQIGRGNRAFIRDNVLVSLVDPECTTVGVGLSSNSPNLVFEGNRIISNYCCVSFGTHRGRADNVKWLSNTFVKIGDDPRFCTFGTARSSFAGNILTDCRFEGGAKIEFQSESKDKGDLHFKWHLDVKTAPGATVTVKDKTGKQVFSGKTDWSGRLRPVVTQLILRYAGDGKVAKELFTPHTVTAEKGGKTASRSVTVDKSKAIEVYP